MSLFSMFGGKKEPVSEFQIVSYQMAYGMLPHAALKDAAAFMPALKAEGSSSMLVHIFLEICKSLKVNPAGLEKIISQIDLQSRRLPDGRVAHIVKYPTPTKVETHNGAEVMPPYFSIIIEDRAGRNECFVLGRSPSALDPNSKRQTTFRQVTADGANMNLGPGPAPTLDALWHFLQTGDGALE